MSTPAPPIVPAAKGQRGERGPANVRGYIAMGIAVAIALGVLGTQVADNRDQNRKLAGQTRQLAAQTDAIAAQADAIARQNDRIEDEGRIRRDQSCRLFEGQHLADVKQLRRTYRYLTNLSAADLRSSLNRAILAQLPGTEAEARRDKAPNYCDEPGVGLKEPDPKIPKRPRSLGVTP